MLPESRLFKFIDSQKGFSLNFIEGQKVINDLAIIHDLKPHGLVFFRNSVLTCQMLISFLKDGESLGIYIDNEDPYVKFKIECNSSGYYRTLLLPENFNDFPNKITGVVRLSKLFPGNNEPYNSFIEVNNLSLEKIVNTILKTTYQVKAEVHLSESSDQAIMVSKLPSANVDKQDQDKDEEITLHDFYESTKETFDKLGEDAQTNEGEIIKSFEKAGLTYLGSTKIQFQCGCSRERMINGLNALLATTSIDELFQEKDTLEAKCDYCNTFYEIQKKELIKIH